MKALFDAQSDTVSEQWSESQSVSVGRPRGNIPKLEDVLSDDADSISPVFNGLQSAAGIPIMRIVSIDSPNQDVRIDQNIHLALVVLSVDALSREGTIRQNGSAGSVSITFSNSASQSFDGFCGRTNTERTSLRRVSTETPRDFASAVIPASISGGNSISIRPPTLIVPS